MPKSPGDAAHGLAFGVAYIAHSEIISSTYNFSGEVVSRDRELWNFVMPSLSYEFGFKLFSNSYGYTKITAGPRLLGQDESIGTVFTEAGLVSRVSPVAPQ